MTKITRRGLLGAAATGTLSVAACATPAPAAPKTAPYAGEVEFLHGVASGDPLPDRVILWTRVTPKSGTGPIPVTYEVMDPADPAAPILHTCCTKVTPSMSLSIASIIGHIVCLMFIALVFTCLDLPDLVW